MSDDRRAPSCPSKDLSDEALLFQVRLHSGENEAQTRARFDVWRARSPEHEAAAREAEALWSHTSELHSDPLSGRIGPGRRRPLLSRRQVLGGLAGLGIAAGGGALAPRILPAYLADVSTGLAELRTIRLPDGSEAVLAAQTRLDLRFDAAIRTVDLLEGQAFQVSPDRSRPFEVRQGERTVRALGTAFDVDARLPEGGLAVAVAEHSVRISQDGSDLALVLKEGERVVVGANGEPARRSSTEIGAVALWRSGTYIAEERPLGEVVATLRAYYPGWIVLRGPALANLSVNAVLDLKRPGASLEALAIGLPIRVRRLSDILTLIEPA